MSALLLSSLLSVAAAPTTAPKPKVTPPLSLTVVVEDAAPPRAARSETITVGIAGAGQCAKATDHRHHLSYALEICWRKGPPENPEVSVVLSRNLSSKTAVSRRLEVTTRARLGKRVPIGRILSEDGTHMKVTVETARLGKSTGS